MRFSYAKRADVLYVVVEETQNPCIYIELESGAICRVDETTKRVVGVTVPFFSRVATAEKGLDIPEIKFHIDADVLLQGAYV